MLRFGQPEITAFAQVALSGQLFRYHAGGQCARFEQRFAKALGVPHALLTSSGSTALTAALAGFGVGPGDEVLVPAHTPSGSGWHACHPMGSETVPFVSAAERRLS